MVFVPDMDSNTPVWFITAASSGFGHEIAIVALKRGHRVIATARNVENIRDLERSGAFVLALDVTRPLPDIEAIAKEAMEKYGRVDYLINAAGYILDAALEEATPEETYQQFNTNVFGAVNTIRAFLPLLRAQPLPSNGGPRATVVTFGSLGSWRGGASFSIYSMTKVCMSSLAESLRIELSPFQINATVIEPGYFRTGFLNPGAKISAINRIVAYEDESTPSGSVRKALSHADGKQLGDVKKGGEVCVDILTGSGLAKDKELPVRIVLGSDCEKVIREKCVNTLDLLDTWSHISRTTDHLEGS